MATKSIPAGADIDTSTAPRAAGPAQQSDVEERATIWRPNLERLGQRYGTIAILVLLFVYFAIRTDNDVFTTTDNLNSILQTSAVLGIVAAGLTLVLVIGAFDLSIAGNMVLATLLSAKIAVDSGSTDLGVLLAVGIAGAVGLANGLIVTVLRVPPFIGTLAMGLFILVGFQQKVAPDGTVSLDLPANFDEWGQGDAFGIRYTVIIAAAVLLFAHFLLKHTVLGRHMYAVGGGAEAARLSGVRIDLVRVIAFTLCGLACGLGGFLTASTFGLGSAQAGGSILLDAFTACFIGASTLTVGRFHIVGTTLGVLTLGMLTNGLTLTGWTSDDVPIAKGVILIVAVAAAGLLRRRQ